jgi:putative Mn2+ efflux pump MntP
LAGSGFIDAPVWLVALGLAMDAFAVSLGVGTLRQARSARPVFRVSFHMGLFQGLMTFLGWLLGTSIAPLIASFDHWIALVLLGIVGGRMVLSGVKAEAESYPGDPSRGGLLILLCVACSIDAMAVGLSLALMEVDILASSLTIGLVTLGLSIVGLMGGSVLGKRFGKRMEVLGGLILIGIGIRIVIGHLL